jgi:hypothetical protein
MSGHQKLKVMPCPYCTRHRHIQPLGWANHLRNKHPDLPTHTPYPSDWTRTPAHSEPSARGGGEERPSAETPEEENAGGDGGGGGERDRQDRGGHDEVVNRMAPAPSGCVRKVGGVQESAFVSVLPRHFQMTSALLCSAMCVTEREWGWPEMEAGEWLDNYLYHSMKRFGYVLGAYRVVRPRED